MSGTGEPDNASGRANARYQSNFSPTIALRSETMVREAEKMPLTCCDHQMAFGLPLKPTLAFGAMR